MKKTIRVGNKQLPVFANLDEAAAMGMAHQWCGPYFVVAGRVYYWCCGHITLDGRTEPQAAHGWMSLGSVADARANFRKADEAAIRKGIEQED